MDKTNLPNWLFSQNTESEDGKDVGKDVGKIGKQHKRFDDYVSDSSEDGEETTPLPRYVHREALTPSKTMWETFDKTTSNIAEPMTIDDNSIVYHSMQTKYENTKKPAKTVTFLSPTTSLNPVKTETILSGQKQSEKKERNPRKAIKTPPKTPPKTYLNPEKGTSVNPVKTVTNLDKSDTSELLNSRIRATQEDAMMKATSGASGGASGGAEFNSNVDTQSLHNYEGRNPRPENNPTAYVPVLDRKNPDALNPEATVPKSPNRGGLQNKFVDKDQAEMYMCTFCFLVLRDPVQITPCGHSFCKSCWQHWSSLTDGTTRCPLDNRIISVNDVFEDNGQNMKIRGLRVFCRNYDIGCEIYPEFRDINEHEQKCEYETVSCSLGCGEIMYRLYLPSHVKHRCGHRQMTCDTCRCAMIAKELQGHDVLCPMKSVTCNYCDQLNILRKDLTDHQTFHCDKFPTYCVFATCGCSQKIVREDMEEHHKLKTENHLLLLHNSVFRVYSGDSSSNAGSSPVADDETIMQLGALSSSAGKMVKTGNIRISPSNDDVLSDIGELERLTADNGTSENVANSPAVEIEGEIVANETVLDGSSSSLTANNKNDENAIAEKDEDKSDIIQMENVPIAADNNAEGGHVDHEISVRKNTRLELPRHLWNKVMNTGDYVSGSYNGFMNHYMQQDKEIKRLNESLEKSNVDSRFEIWNLKEQLASCNEKILKLAKHLKDPLASSDEEIMTEKTLENLNNDWKSLAVVSCCVCGKRL